MSVWAILIHEKRVIERWANLETKSECPALVYLHTEFVGSILYRTVCDTVFSILFCCLLHPVFFLLSIPPAENCSYSNDLFFSFVRLFPLPNPPSLFQKQFTYLNIYLQNLSNIHSQKWYFQDNTNDFYKGPFIFCSHVCFSYINNYWIW